MRVIVTGDRHWHCRGLAASVVRRLLDRYGPGLVVVHGGAPGVDRTFAEAEAEAHLADWDRFSHAAGPRRNQARVDAGAGFLIAYHQFLAGSRGPKNASGGRWRRGSRST